MLCASPCELLMNLRFTQHICKWHECIYFEYCFWKIAQFLTSAGKSIPQWLQMDDVFLSFITRITNSTFNVGIKPLKFIFRHIIIKKAMSFDIGMLFVGLKSSYFWLMSLYDYVWINHLLCLECITCDT